MPSLAEWWSALRRPSTSPFSLLPSSISSVILLSLALSSLSVSLAPGLLLPPVDSKRPPATGTLRSSRTSRLRSWVLNDVSPSTLLPTSSPLVSTPVMMHLSKLQLPSVSIRPAVRSRSYAKGSLVVMRSGATRLRVAPRSKSSSRGLLRSERLNDTANPWSPSRPRLPCACAPSSLRWRQSRSSPCPQRGGHRLGQAPPARR
mmetsp:Transcript_35819/g.90277  ORF Transcript_35819/g.90277 Transcript_35819/m.90277 type:complete len:203 (-) Transcript_35819:1130-1738(-)